MKTLLILLLLTLHAACATAQGRRHIVGGDKLVWDPVIRTWVYHQGTTTLKANRGINSLRENKIFDTGRSKNEVSCPKWRGIAGGEKLVWDPSLKIWVYQRGTRTIKANRGINAPPTMSARRNPPRVPRSLVLNSRESEPKMIINPYVEE